MFCSRIGMGYIRPALIQSIIELRAIKAADLNANISEKDIRKTFSLLKKYHVKVPLSLFGAITGQRGGTCLPSVTKAWIRRHAHHLGLYKQLMFSCMQRLIVEGYQAVKGSLGDDTVAGSDLRRILQYVAKNSMRQSAKLLDETNGFGVLTSPEHGLQALATAQDLLQKIEEAEKQLILSKKEESARIDLSAIDLDSQIDQRKGKKRSNNLKANSQESVITPSLTSQSCLIPQILTWPSVQP